MAVLIVWLGPLLAEAQPQDTKAKPEPAKPAAAAQPATAKPSTASSANTKPAAAPSAKSVASKNKPAGAGSSAAPANPADQPAETGFTPEKYYQLLLERQSLQISSNKQILVILDAHGNDPVKAKADLQKHEEERDAKNDALFQRYGVSADQYYQSSRGTDEQAKRAKYLDGHDEVRDEIAANSKELRAMEKEVWRGLAPGWTTPPRTTNRKETIERGP